MHEGIGKVGFLLRNEAGKCTVAGRLYLVETTYWKSELIVIKCGMELAIVEGVSKVDG